MSVQRPRRLHDLEGARPCRSLSISAALIAASLAVVSPLAAQQQSPSIRSVLSGYASIGYGADVEGENHNNFNAGASLVPLFLIDDDLLVESEIEFSLHDEATLIDLEHASVHYLGFDSLILTAGKFHLPFGIWHHTNWVNRMPDPPLMYEDAHGEPASEGLLPILFDLGAKAEWTLPFGRMTTLTGWVTQGPQVGEAHAHADEDPAAEEEEIVPMLAYGSNYTDNNGNKMVGGRIRTMLPGGLMLAGSGYRAAYDEAGDLNVTAYNLSVMWAPGETLNPLFDLRGEVTWLDQEFVHHDEAETVGHGGYYLQVSKRVQALEPIVRWSALPEALVDDHHFQESHRQLALGINYWLKPSSPFKIAYQWEPDHPDRVVAEWAVGF